MASNKKFNSAVSSYAPKPHSLNGMTSQVSPSTSLYLEARILNLEEEHGSLSLQIDLLREMQEDLASSVDELKNGGWPVTVGPFAAQDPIESHQSALKFKQELEQLSREVHKSIDGDADEEKANGTTTPKPNVSVPPHVRAANGGSNASASSNSLPPHLRSKPASETKEPVTKSPNSRLVTDGPVDTTYKATIPAPMPSPPSSPATVVQQDFYVDKLSLNAWKPHFVKTLSPISIDAKIPGDMATFHPQFLEEHLGGTDWSPGLRYIVGHGTCILKNRTYYMLDPTTEPYLPDQPGEHGAKLTAFFNVTPESEHGDLPGGATSWENVPMFVEQPGTGRYVYYGNYSQTRWSDKLDVDTMMARVPQHVKDFWATELTSTIRPAWMTQELKKHFFKKPDYIGKIVAAPEADTTTINSDMEVKIDEKMAKDVRKYVEELREWEREANMKTAMIKKQFILDAFEAADMDDPPALRLWWEYLECVNWRKDFYDLLVTLQSRDKRFAE
ncbi:hypothetical protein HBI38_148640 [Parastagonospora nodorum]|nr:hypothetical protein HBH50_103450 [Parastagonospora nodorum]KAH4090135.1 hypothetical protein HBH48_107220 [Parastagonospora nodorum]KAH4228059.1 hypothetical protein HBI06_099530 [Parastagonospora nodorum]KAH4235665.1 hypothetical protein HBI05_143590 [Parastagonospora nodorum]KAH4942937.1 hypothetical protein HBH73_150370 [Parastagonospora nodorum]